MRRRGDRERNSGPGPRHGKHSGQPPQQPGSWSPAPDQIQPPHPEARQYQWQQPGRDQWLSSQPIADWVLQPERPAQSPPGPARASHGSRPAGRSRRRTITILVVVAVLIAGGAAAGGSYLLLRTKGSPQQTAAAYLSAWQRGDYRAMNKVTVGRPHGGLAGPLTRAADQLGVRSTSLKLGAVTAGAGSAQAHFTVTDDLASNHTWTYHGVLHLVDRNRRWSVSWSPAAIYPGLKPGERFTLTSSWPARASILSADGAVLSSPAVQAQSGSISLLTGVVAAATAAQAKKLGAPYKAGDPIGVGGIEAAYQNRLAGSPSLTIKIARPGKGIDRTVHEFAAEAGQPVRTSIQMSVQLAASHAVSGASTTKPVDMVVIQPSTGKVLAVVERPGGWNRALQGTFPPGSTFKIVTASGLARTGLNPSSQVQCPSTVNIGGYTIHNDQNEHLGTTDLLHAFAISCNTTFAQLATQRLTGSSLASMARTYGYNSKPALGIPAALGSFSRPTSSTDLAADAFGQGKDLVSPLSQAAEVAAVANGSWRPPVLVTSPAPKQAARPHAISPAILATLRPMMHAVVTIGTAAGVGFPPDVYGKTGTAEYGTGPHLKSHGWFIGYRADLAFAVLVEGGGFGASSAGPIANAFLRHA
jgi:Penicillin binding protein transpeptidase domain/NTF2-like N-terminal transpeptidase domain